MAVLTSQDTGERVEDASRIAALLEAHGIVYEHWDIGRYDAGAKPAGVTEQDWVLECFAEEIERLKRQRGYSAADVIALTPDLPNLDEICAKFDREHTHDEDEVRFVVRGRGVFAIRGRDGSMWDVEVHPGDLLAVPEGTKHYFTLCEDRTIQCIRLFSDPAGWVAHYVEGGAVASGR